MTCERPSTRWKLTIEYDGTPFSGWQRQDNAITVQEVMEDAIFKFAGERAVMTVAGRTDAGVHARGQVAHVDIKRPSTSKEIRDAITFHAGNNPICVVAAEKMPNDFHARFHAKMRHYQYVMINRRAPTVLDAHYAWHIRSILDINAMQRAANYLIGEHDYTSFRASECQAKSPNRSIDRINIKREGDFVYVDVSALSFLHHQVRNIVGTLEKIGRGIWAPERMDHILKARDRTVAGPTAPAKGLFFIQVDY